MEFELALVKNHHHMNEIPVRDIPPDDDRLDEDLVPRSEMIQRRAMIRAEVDDLIRVAFVKGDVVAFAIRMVRCTFAVAGVAAQFGTKPEFQHFGEAATELLQSAQSRLDKALTARDWHGVRVALAQMETVLYGITANVGLPYAALVQYMDKIYTTKDAKVERPVIADLLRKAGIDVPKELGEAQNDD